MEVLPAAHGDALLVEWGSRRKPHRMLVDAGPLGTYRTVHKRLKALGPSRFELLVVTHIDGDHVEGVVRLLQDRQALGLTFGDVWFNGWPQLTAVTDDLGDELGALQGEMVGALLTRQELPWNAAFDGGPVLAQARKPLPVVELPGGATVTVLGPGPAQLRRLRKSWTRVLRDAGMEPGDVDEALRRLAERQDLAALEAIADVQGGRKRKLDSSVANGASTVLLVEHEGHSLLLTGDAHGPVLAQGLRRLLRERGGERLSVDVFKLPHHASRGNVTADVLSLVETSRYVVSTNGARYRHPDPEALDLVLAQPHDGDDVELLFNCRSATTEPWADERSQRRLGYSAVFPEDADRGLVVTL